MKSKGLSDESIKPLSISNKMFNPSVNYVRTKARVEFKGDCLKQEKITFNRGKIGNIYFVHKKQTFNSSSYPTLENCLFDAVKLTKPVVDAGLYKYSGCGIRFDRKGYYSIGNETGRNIIIFGVDMSLSRHIDNKEKDIWNLGKSPTQGWEHTLIAEKLYSVNFTKEDTKFCLSLHYNGANSHLFVNGTEIIKFKVKNSEIATYPLCLGNISKDRSVDNRKKNWTKRLCLWF